MNKSRLFKRLFLLLCVIGTAAYGQKKETKTYKEVFNVTPETVLDIDTNNTDIEFTTWNSNQIEIEATIEIEGATSEEAKKYFENGTIEIIGNSKKVSVKTGGENTWLFRHTVGGNSPLHFDNGFGFEINDIISDSMNNFTGDSLFLAFDLMEAMPPMPPVPPINFDYDAFEKDGEEYLKKWQSEFKDGFGKEYQEKMKAWQQKLEEKQRKSGEKRAKLIEKRVEERSEKMNKRAEERAERMHTIQKRRANAAKRRVSRFPSGVHIIDSTGRFSFSGDSINYKEPNSFYFSSDGKNRNYKVKKSIKIRMPKGNKIKMNVRHGEVKLAANTLNIDANLSYSNLLAYEIDGAATTVRASYSPIFVEKWNLGQLQTEYSDAVNLQEVFDLRLSATSSEVTIDRLHDKAIIKNDFGPLKILSVSNNFTDLDVSLQNAELECDMPNTAFTLYVNGTASKLTLPATVQIERTKNGNTMIHRGYYKNRNSNKGIIINSKYSEVVLD